MREITANIKSEIILKTVGVLFTSFTKKIGTTKLYFLGMILHSKVTYEHFCNFLFLFFYSMI